ncbi:MAG: hypothetical protein E6767_01700 [Dysgonomonas sp.]|nr:hypothetical protein [Dysgonomonas sp.]
MKRAYLILCLISFCSISVFSQKAMVSINGNYRTEAKDFGLGTQVMIPIYKGLHIAPGITYFFEKEYEFDTYMVKGKVKNKTLNYGVDIHYAFNLPYSRSFVSPFIGVEGMSSWSNTSGSSMGITQGNPGSVVPNYKWSSFGGNFNNFTVLGNVGVAAKWFASNNIFINTQVKYSLLFDDMDSNHFVFTAGLGYAF